LGPVAPVHRFKTDDEAIKMANDTEFGLLAIGRIDQWPRGSKYGIEEFLEVKYLCVGGINR
jgi:succinate-semialdehyde dehydrogenase/glutarate-semialdehyde dehydrogenase